MATRTVAAHQLRPGWTVMLPAGQHRRVALARCQGARPHVVVAWVGIAGRTRYPAGARVTIQDSAR